MRVGSGGSLHLAYCTNVHPGEGWTETLACLERYLPPLKAALAPDAPFGVGLRLSDRASRELLQGNQLDRFAAWLGARGLYVFTLNGFPYGGFHGGAVKDAVYAPDWTRSERLAYTLRLARILAALLPDGVEGGISTVPVSYKRWHATAAARGAAAAAGAEALLQAAEALARLVAETGRVIHLDLEPEPDCLLEDAAEVTAFFRDHLLRRAEVPGGEAVVLRHLRVCWDACHAAVEYEATADALRRFDALGIEIGKLQLSSALKAGLGDAAARRALSERLRPFAEGTYLHQVVERRADGALRRHADLDAALEGILDPLALEWRVHFHVPIFTPECGGLATTQPELLEALALLRHRPFCEHLEVETYTWDVLPPTLRLELPLSLRREYEWTLAMLAPGTGRRPCVE